MYFLGVFSHYVGQNFTLNQILSSYSIELVKIFCASFFRSDQIPECSERAINSPFFLFYENFTAIRCKCFKRPLNNLEKV